MRYEKFLLQDTPARLTYLVVVPDDIVTGLDPSLKRTSNTRWIDSGVDLMSIMYVGLTPAPGGGLVASKMLFLFQGFGARCNMRVAGAPSAQHGAIALKDGREAVWAVGVEEDNWKRPGLAWIAWQASDHRTITRVEGIGLGLSRVQEAALAISQRI